MNALFFYAALSLMLGGGVFLLSARKRSVRRGAVLAVMGGLCLFAAGVREWIVLGLDSLALLVLLVLFLHRRRLERRTEGAGLHGSAPVPGKTEDEEVHAGSPLRKGVAALLSAGMGGLLFSVVGNNPLWKTNFPAEPLFTPPGFGIVLLPALLLLLWFFSAQSGRRDRRQTNDPK